MKLSRNKIYKISKTKNQSRRKYKKIIRIKKEVLEEKEILI